MDPHLGRPGDELDAQDRVPAQLEEVVVHPHLLEAQDLGPHPRQQLLGGRARRHVGGLELGAALGCGQGGPVQLAVGAERQGGQLHEGRGHHVVGQAAREVGPQVGDRRGLVRFGHHVGDQTLGPRAVGARHHRRLAHREVGHKGRLHLPRLDAIAADLHLVVDATEELDGAVGPPPAQVAAAIEPGPGVEGVGHEALGGELGAIQIAAGQPRPPDVDLAGHPHRHRGPAGVEDVDGGVGDGPADGGGALVLGGTAGDAGAHRGLGGAIGVEQGAARCPAMYELPPTFFAGDDETSERRKRREVLSPSRRGWRRQLATFQAQQCRRKSGDGDAEIVDLLQNVAVPTGHTQCGPVGQRHECLRHRGVKRE